MKRSDNKGQNNPMWGRHHSVQARAKIGVANLGTLNGQWKGDDVGYFSLHEWIKKRLPKPERCQRCNTISPYDLANISGEYNREIGDWWWICRSCHMVTDGRMEKLHSQNIKGWYQSCSLCGNKYWVTPSLWNRGWGRYCSKSCSNRGRGNGKISVPQLQGGDEVASQEHYYQRRTMEM